MGVDTHIADDIATEENAKGIAAGALLCALFGGFLFGLLFGFLLWHRV